jgi:hypothetical protein
LRPAGDQRLVNVMSTPGDTLHKYVIALKSRRECPQTPDDLLGAVRALLDVRVIEGEGLRALTVEMPEDTARFAARQIDFATVSPYRELKLL